MSFHDCSGAALVVAALAAMTSVVATVAPANAAPSCHGHVATIVGTDGADVIHGTPHADVIVAGDGADVVYGEGGNDIICGGRGLIEYRHPPISDRIYGGPGDDIIDGGPGPDRLHGGAGADHLYGGSGADWLYDGPGNDRAYGGTGKNDRFIDGTGDDVLVGGPRSEPSGTNLVDFRGSASGVVVDLAADTATGDGNDVVRHIWKVFGSAHDDVIRGSDHNDLIKTGCGNDVIRAGGGSDQIWPSGDGCDTGTDSDVVYGGDGDDTVDESTPEPSELDRFFGGNGGDSLLSAGGHDDFHGGPGADGFSAAVFYHGTSPLDIDLAAGTYHFGAVDGSVSSVEDVGGTSLADHLTGNAADNIIYGFQGNDVLRGRGGDDDLYGGVLVGGTEDTAYGGTGTDTCFAAVTYDCEN